MTKKFNYRLMVKSTLASGLLLLANNSVQASAFAIQDQGVTYLGNAYAGTTSAAQDASTSYYNPAGMSELPANQLVASGTYFKQNIKLYNATAMNSDEGVLTGNNPCYPKSNYVTPAGHFVWRATEKFSMGISVVEPFRLDTKYSSTDIARVMATETKITSVLISPTVGYKLHKKFSVGAGLDFLRINSKFSTDLDYGGVGSEAGGFVTNSAGRWNLGYHLGILYKPQPATKIGLAYFSRFNCNFSGATQSRNAVNFFRANEATYTLKLPDRINFGVAHFFTPKWQVMGELEWTHWSRLKTINFLYNSPARQGIKSFHYSNTWRLSLGSDYMLVPGLTVKGGVGFDQSPTNNTYRNAMLPDSNRYLLALGAKLEFSQYVALVAGYSHIFFQNTTINETGPISNLNSSTQLPNTSSLRADVSNNANVFGLQLVCTFGKKAKSKPATKSTSKAKTKAKSKSK